MSLASRDEPTTSRKRRVTPSDWAVLGFTLLYIAGATPWALLRGNIEFLLYVAVMLLMIGLVAAIHLRVGLSREVLVGLSLWGLIHMAGGLMPVPEGWPIHGDKRVLYSLWLIPDYLKYDQLVHAFGFGVTTWVCWQGLCAATGVRRPTVGLLLLCAAAGMGFGAVNEVVEFIATLSVPETNVGGYANTGWDLVANGVGAAAAVTLIAVGNRKAAKEEQRASAMS